MTTTLEQLQQMKLSDQIPVYIAEMYGAQKAGLELRMRNWYTTGKDGEVCSVCLGGALMAGTVGFQKGKMLDVVGKCRLRGESIFRPDYICNDLRQAFYYNAIEEAGKDIPESAIDPIGDMEMKHFAFASDIEIQLTPMSTFQIDQLAANLTEFANLLKEYDL